MKTENPKVYLELLNDYLSGAGLDLDNHHLTKEDIEPMMDFYSRILKPDLYRLIDENIISMLINNEI